MGAYHILTTVDSDDILVRNRTYYDVLVRVRTYYDRSGGVISNGEVEPEYFTLSSLL
jgi:hypothetical protein